MKEYGVLIATSHTTLGKNVGSCKENFKAKIGDTKELLQREGSSSMLFLKIKEDLSNSTVRS